MCGGPVEVETSETTGTVCCFSSSAGAHGCGPLLRVSPWRWNGPPSGTLATKAWPSKMSLEMKGDVIEASLAIARLTGPEIPRHLRIAHEDYNAKMNDFDNAFDRMLRFATTDNDGPPSMAAFPPPDVLAKLILMVFSGEHANFEKTASKIARFEVWNGDGVMLQSVSNRATMLQSVST